MSCINVCNEVCIWSKCILRLNMFGVFLTMQQRPPFICGVWSDSPTELLSPTSPRRNESSSWASWRRGDFTFLLNVLWNGLSALWPCLLFSFFIHQTSDCYWFLYFTRSHTLKDLNDMQLSKIIDSMEEVRTPRVNDFFLGEPIQKYT